MNENLLAVLSLGRSGSTFLQRMLNCCGEINVCGEHNGILTAPAHMRSTLADWAQDGFTRDSARQKAGNRGSFTAWATPYDAEDLVRAVRSLMTELYSDVAGEYTWWGFKEIRYGREELSLIRAAFPDTHVLFLRRNFPDYALSRFSSFEAGLDPDYETYCKLRYDHDERYAAFDEDCVRDPDQSLSLDYEELVHDPESRLREVANWLGIRQEQIGVSDMAAVSDTRTDYVSDETKQEKTARLKDLLTGWDKRFEDGDRPEIVSNPFWGWRRPDT